MDTGNVEIIEQPAERSLRFRYESEGRNGGSILGVNSTHDNATYPKIRVNNYTGPIAVYVSCVTNESKFVFYTFFCRLYIFNVHSKTSRSFPSV